MPSFDSVREALSYVVDDLVPADHGFTVNVLGPDDQDTPLQVVPAHYVDGLPRTMALTVHLALDDADDLAAFEQWPGRRSFERVDWRGIPCFARSFGTDVDAASQCVAEVLRAVCGYTEGTPLTVEVIDEGRRWGVGRREPMKAGR
jgi:hypothetical protein